MKLPLNWTKKTIGELKLEIGDGNYSSLYPKSNEFVDTGVLFFTANSIQANRLTTIGARFISKEKHSTLKKGQLKKGDILLSTRGDIGKTALVPDEFVGQNINAQLVRLNPMGKMDSTYLWQYLSTTWVKSKIESFQTGSALKQLPIGSLKKIEILYPPLEEQKKIAQVLSTWDEAIEAVKELIEKKKTAKRVLHSSIFSENSKSWQKQRLSDVVIILDNKRVPLNSEQRNNMLGNIPYYGANGVVGYVNDYIFDEDLILMAEDGGYFDEYKTRPIAYKITGKAWVNNHAHVLKVREGFDYNFIFHSLEHKNILRFLNGGTRAKLNRGELEKLPIYLPRTYEEQKEIGNLFAFIDEEIELQGDKLVLLKKQKNGLMQRLLTGKVRVSNHD